LDVMKDIPDKSIDMVLCDLPYQITKCEWDIIIPFEPLWEQYKRVAKDRAAIVLTASQPFTSMLVMSNLKMFKYCLVWLKTRPSNIFNAKKQFMKWHEDICIFYNKLPTYNAQTREGNSYKKKHYLQNRKNGIFGKTGEIDGHISENNGIMQPKTVIEISNPNHASLHPTQKPVALFEYLIKTYTNEGDVVLDNAAGSGTTGVACKNLNRNFILIEKEQKYYDIILKRLADV